MPNTKINKSSQLFDNITDISFLFYRVLKEAVKSKAWKIRENQLLFLGFFLATSAVIHQDHHLYLIQQFSFEIFHQNALNLSDKIGLELEILINFLFCLFVSFFFLGLKPYRIILMYQKGIDRLRLKSGLDERPKVLDVKNIDENRTKLLINSTGLGQNRYKDKFDDLRASTGQRVESIKYNEEDNTLVEIFLAKHPLEKFVKYEELCSYLEKPYSFVVGKTLGKVITQSIEELPHLMIGGTSGGGKSVALNNTLIGLLESSNNIQMYLVDLKGGLEVKAYENLPNVTIIKNVQEATTTLKQLVGEMERRYEYLEQNDHKKLDPMRDNLNRIIFAVDECTDLLGKVNREHSDYSFINMAIEHCDKLARKARASGIHLILATQKMDKSSIPTRIQENLAGRLAMKTKTMENAIRLIGSRKAYDLPDIKGRAVWSLSNDCIEVQGPLISDEELEKRVKNLKEKYENKEKFFCGLKLKVKNEFFVKVSKEDELNKIPRINSPSGKDA